MHRGLVNRDYTITNAFDIELRSLDRSILCYEPGHYVHQLTSDDLSLPLQVHAPLVIPLISWLSRHSLPSEQPIESIACCMGVPPLYTRVHGGPQNRQLFVYDYVCSIIRKEDEHVVQTFDATAICLYKCYINQRDTFFSIFFPIFWLSLFFCRDKYIKLCTRSILESQQKHDSTRSFSLCFESKFKCDLKASICSRRRCTYWTLHACASIRVSHLKGSCAFNGRLRELRVVTDEWYDSNQRANIRQYSSTAGSI